MTKLTIEKKGSNFHKIKYLNVFVQTLYEIWCRQKKTALLPAQIFV